MTRRRSLGGSLFLKIFVWFWLAMILVAAASTLVAVTHVRRQEGRRAHLAGDRPFPDPHRPMRPPASRPTLSQTEAWIRLFPIAPIGVVVAGG